MKEPCNLRNSKNIREINPRKIEGNIKICFEINLTENKIVEED